MFLDEETCMCIRWHGEGLGSKKVRVSNLGTIWSPFLLCFIFCSVDKTSANRQKLLENEFARIKMRDGISLVALKGLLQLDT